MREGAGEEREVLAAEGLVDDQPGVPATLYGVRLRVDARCGDGAELNSDEHHGAAFCSRSRDEEVVRRLRDRPRQRGEGRPQGRIGNLERHETGVEQRHHPVDGGGVIREASFGERGQQSAQLVLGGRRALRGSQRACRRVDGGAEEFDVLRFCRVPSENRLRQGLGVESSGGRLSCGRSLDARRCRRRGLRLDPPRGRRRRWRVRGVRRVRVGARRRCGADERHRGARRCNMGELHSINVARTTGRARRTRSPLRRALERPGRSSCGLVPAHYDANGVEARRANVHEVEDASSGKCGQLPAGGACVDFLGPGDDHHEIVNTLSSRSGTPTTEHRIRVR